MSGVPGVGDARIHQQGYRRYDGLRRGPDSAMRAVAVHTLRFILGYRRRARSKVVPIGILVVAVLPALGFTAALLAIPAFAREVASEILPGPEAYLGGTIFLTYIAAAVAGPAALCGDRVHGTLALYLASPLTRDTYLVGKAMAVMGYLGAMTIIPSLVYVLGTSLSAASDLGATAIATDVLQVLVAGTMMAVSYGALGLAAAAIADRQGAASALVVGFVMISGIVVSIIVEGFGLPEFLGALDVNRAFLALVIHVHGQGDADMPFNVAGSIGAWAAWVVGLLALVRWRYARLQVTR